MESMPCKSANNSLKFSFYEACFGGPVAVNVMVRENMYVRLPNVYKLNFPAF